MINDKQKLEINPEIILQEVDDQTILLNPNTGHIFGLDRVSTRVWELLGEKSDLISVKRQMLLDFQVEEDRLSKDLEIYFGQLLELELIRPVPEQNEAQGTSE